jgi:putative membrane protein
MCRTWNQAMRAATSLAAIVGIVAVAAVAAHAERAARPLVSGLDRHFLVAADQENWFAYTAAQMATRRSPTQFGKQLGDVVAADHLEQEARLNLLASKTQVPVSRRITPTDHWELHELGTLSGPAFDQRYSELVMAHVSASTANVLEELRYGSNAAVRAYARQLLPTLRVHQRLANELSRSSH